MDKLVQERCNSIANILELVFLTWTHLYVYINGLMQERRNSIANALELYLSCTNPSILSDEF